MEDFILYSVTKIDELVALFDHMSMVRYTVQ